MKALFHFLAVCLLISAAAPVLAASLCSLPPMDTNPYSRQDGLGSDNPYSLWKSDSHTFNPYSSPPGAGENIYHEAMQDTDEPGYWVVKTYPINYGLNLKLQFDGHVSASQVDANGNPDNTGKYLTIVNHNKAPVYFNWTTSVLNSKLMPGESRRIGLGIYQPANKIALPFSVPLTIKYWMSTGSAPDPPKHCSTNREFFMNAASSQAAYDVAKKYITWATYRVNFPEMASHELNGKPASYTQYIGPIVVTVFATPSKRTGTWVNTGRTVALRQCDGADTMSVFQPGETQTDTNEHDPDKFYGWAALSLSCKVAVAPADLVHIPAKLPKYKFTIPDDIVNTAPKK
jgi:hypothetical protein